MTEKEAAGADISVLRPPPGQLKIKQIPHQKIPAILASRGIVMTDSSVETTTVSTA